MRPVNEKNLTIGPGKVAQALGIRLSHSGETIGDNKIWIEDLGLKIASEKILIGPRIGVDSAGKDALLPYRFRVVEEIDF